MNTQIKKQISIFPDSPRDKKIVDENGNITDVWSLYFDQLTRALQTNFKPEGVVIPSQSADNISLLGDASASIGNIIYDSTNNQFKGIILVSIIDDVVTTITKTFTLT
jgi:hypothetical protein